MTHVIRNIGDHAEDLEDGRVVGIGETCELTNDQFNSEFNKSKISSEGPLLDIPDEALDAEDQTPDRRALMDRAGELDITGRSRMRNDELQTAIIAAESNQKGGSD